MEKDFGKNRQVRDNTGMDARKFKVFHFFAGGGFVEFGMPRELFESVFANDFDEMKCEYHRKNLPGMHIHCGDVANIRAGQLPGVPDLIWASPPCQDISLAGKGAGLNGKKSSAFFPFFRLVKELVDQRRAPKVVVIENVKSLTTSHKGADLALILSMFDDIGYQALVTTLDARWFVPQSRERTFIILWPKSVQFDIASDAQRLKRVKPGIFSFVPRFSMFTQYGSRTFEHDSWNDPDCKLDWLRNVLRRQSVVGVDEIEDVAKEVNHPDWLRDSPVDSLFVGWRRTRTKDGVKTTHFELNDTGPMGCLRTYSGGSSVPTLFHKISDTEVVRSRLPAYLGMIVMGFEPTTLRIKLMLSSGRLNDYQLPPDYGDAFHIMGDAVVPQCVTFLMSEVVYPLLTEVEASSSLQRTTHRIP